MNSLNSLKQYLRLISLGFIAILLFALPVSAEIEHDKRFFSFVADDGKVIARTAHQISTGDRYYTSDNQLYEVYAVRGNQAKCRKITESAVKMSLMMRIKAFCNGLAYGEKVKAGAAGDEKKKVIGIYHTHTDESYQPSDGTSSRKDNGGIVDVGKILAESLEQEGFEVVHRRDSHDPHDAMSYERSRRTVARMMQQRPSVLLDVHRDAVPAEEYATEIEGRGVTQIQLVVGRENPSFVSNNNFAKQLKASVDDSYPNLIKGIFYGKGKYNQDIGPRVILLEFGTNTNHRESAERAAKYFAVSTADLLSRQGAQRAEGGWRTALWLLLFIGLGIGAYFLLQKKVG